MHCHTLAPPLQGFHITFHFAENPFFSNKELVCVLLAIPQCVAAFPHAQLSLLTQTNQYIMSAETMPNGESILQKIVGPEIQWKPGKDVTVKVCTICCL